jgi:hypothetical protein
MATMLKCDKCGHTAEIPVHCNRPMHAERVGNEVKLVCWMGADCGTAEIPQHCGAPMRETSA